MESSFLNSNYTYTMMQMDIEAIKELYHFVEIKSIGKSVLGKDLTILKIGNGSKEVFYNASFHANEWITTPVLIKFIAEYCSAISNKELIYSYDANSLFNSVTLYIAPMVNPDGVDLVTDKSFQGSTAYVRAQKIADDYPNISFPSRMESKY